MNSPAWIEIAIKNKQQQQNIYDCSQYSNIVIRFSFYFSVLQALETPRNLLCELHQLRKPMSSSHSTLNSFIVKQQSLFDRTAVALWRLQRGGNKKEYFMKNNTFW